MRIRFHSDQIYESGGPGKGPKFSAGQVVDAADVGAALGQEVTPEWAEGFLNRWVQRNLADEVDGRTPTAVEKERTTKDKAKAEKDLVEKTKAALMAKEAAKQPQPESKPAKASEEPAPQPVLPDPRPVSPSVISQPLGTAKRGEPTKGTDGH